MNILTRPLQSDIAVAEDGHTPQPEGKDAVVRGMRVRGMTLFRNASDFIPLTMIPLTDLVVGNATGRADLSRRNLMKAEGAGKSPSGLI